MVKLRLKYLAGKVLACVPSLQQDGALYLRCHQLVICNHNKGILVKLEHHAIPTHCLFLSTDDNAPGLLVGKSAVGSFVPNRNLDAVANLPCPVTGATQTYNTPLYNTARVSAAQY